LVQGGYISNADPADIDWWCLHEPARK
jgi:hypothetical protein